MKTIPRIVAALCNATCIFIALCAISTSLFANDKVVHTEKLSVNLEKSTIDNIDQHFQALTKDKLFSGTVLIAHKDKVLLNEGYGLSSAELDVPNSAITAYRIASITKQFTAAAILRLVDQNKLSLSDTLLKAMPEIVKDAPEEWKKITVRQLLDHTSGMASYTDFTDLRSFSLTPQTPRNMVALTAKQKMNFAPGEKFSYNNSSYIIAGMLIEKISGQPYDVFVRDELLKPAGMEHSGYAFNQAIIPNRAVGYSQEGNEVVNAQHMDMSVPYSAGSLYATASDLMLWNRALYGQRLLSKSSLVTMLDGGKHGYGLGIGVQKGRHGLVYGHTGGMPGVSTVLQYEPEDELSIVVLSNFDFADAGAMANLISEYLRRPTMKLAHQFSLRTTPIAKDEWARISGRYRSEAKDQGADGDKEITIGVVDGVLYAFPSGQLAERLTSISPTHYVAKASLVQCQFEAAKSGAITGLTITIGDTKVKLTKQAPIDIRKTPLFVRGTMNNWETKHPLQAADSQQWDAQFELTAGAHELKIATEDWRTIDLGGIGAMRSVVSLGKAIPLAPRGANLRLWVDEPGVYKVKLDMTSPDVPLMTVSRTPKK
jgi:CubicO group peptidase (beta-lactamase class C family)